VRRPLQPPGQLGARVAGSDNLAGEASLSQWTDSLAASPPLPLAFGPPFGRWLPDNDDDDSNKTITAVAAKQTLEWAPALAGNQLAALRALAGLSCRRWAETKASFGYINSAALRKLGGPTMRSLATKFTPASASYLDFGSAFEAEAAGCGR